VPQAENLEQIHVNNFLHKAGIKIHFGACLKERKFDENIGL
jgi:hypothetical protein